MGEQHVAVIENISKKGGHSCPSFFVAYSLWLCDSVTMKQVKYTGPEGILGRFGKVKAGDILSLLEEEAASVARNPAFVVLRDTPLTGFPTEPGYPRKGGHFDLSSIAWRMPEVLREVRKLRKSKATAAIRQMESFGFPVRSPDRMSVAQMQDLIVEIGRRAGWLG